MKSCVRALKRYMKLKLVSWITELHVVILYACRNHPSGTWLLLFLHALSSISRGRWTGREKHAWINHHSYIKADCTGGISKSASKKREAQGSRGRCLIKITCYSLPVFISCMNGFYTLRQTIYLTCSWIILHYFWWGILM